MLNTRLKFLKDYGEAENRILWDAANGPCSEILFRSLFDNLIVTLNWLYSTSPSDKRSLNWYLTETKSHTKVFEPDEIDDQLRRIDDVAPIVKKVKTLRNKWIGHRDPKTFRNPQEFLKNNRISVGELETLVRLVEEIINEHSMKFDDTELGYEAPILGVERLTACANAKEELFNLSRALIGWKYRSDGEEIKTKAVESLLKKLRLD